MRSTPAIVAIAACCCLGVQAWSGSPSADTAGAALGGSTREKFEEANGVFRRAIETLARDREAGVNLALDAAARYRGLAKEGIRNHLLELNAGNSAMLGGDVGHAVVSFRRAERLEPSNAGVKQSLEAARKAVGVAVGKPAGVVDGPRIVGVVNLWRHVVPRGAVAGVAWIAYLVAWGCAAAGAMGLRGRLKLMGVVAGLVAVVGAGLLGVDEWERSRVVAAVVVQSGVVGLNGPAAGVYEATFQSPLSPGVECVVVEVRGAWSRVRLGDGTMTWVPSGSLELV